MFPEPGNLSPSSCHIHTCKMARPTRSHSSNGQLHIPPALGSLPQEQTSGAQDQISMCVWNTHTQNDPPPGSDSPVSVTQGIQCVFGGHMAWWDVGNHAGFGITDERIPQDLPQTKGRSMKSINKGHINYLLCAGHWAIAPHPLQEGSLQRRNTNDQKYTKKVLHQPKKYKVVRILIFFTQKIKTRDTLPWWGSREMGTLLYRCTLQVVCFRNGISFWEGSLATCIKRKKCACFQGIILKRTAQVIEKKYT